MIRGPPSTSPPGTATISKSPAVTVLLFVSLLIPTGCAVGKADVFLTSTAVPATGPLRVHPVNPRYFTDDAGRAVYLTGSHTWSSLQDVGPPGSAPFDFDAYLNLLQRYNHNFIRLWFVEHAWDAQKGQVVSPHPWARIAPESARDGLPKFDLTRFDTAFFDRMRRRIMAARERGFYVSVMLFDDWSTEHARTWLGHPFHRDNNVNGVDADLDGDGVGVEFHTLGDRTILALQEAYVRKVIDTVNDLDNVLYEVGNEIGVSRAWQYHMIDVINDYQRRKPQRHPIGMTVGSPPLEVDDKALFASKADWISPGSNGGYKDDPPAATGEKVILSDTDHLWGVGGDHTWVWKSFTRGLNPIYMDPLDEGPESGGIRAAARRAMGQTLAYARRMNLAAMVPRPDLASSRYCLADPGSEYLVYLPLPGSVVVDLAGPPGRVQVEWFHPLTGRSVREGTVVTGDVQRFTAPFTDDAVLYLKRSSETGASTSASRPGAVGPRPFARPGL